MIFHELLVLQGPQRLHAKVLYVFEEMLIMLLTFLVLTYLMKTLSWHILMCINFLKLMVYQSLYNYENNQNNRQQGRQSQAFLLSLIKLIICNKDQKQRYGHGWPFGIYLDRAKVYNEWSIKDVYSALVRCSKSFQCIETQNAW